MMQTDADAAPDDAVVIDAQIPDATKDTPTPRNQTASVTTTPKRRGFAGALLGGLIAAVAGFGLAQIVPNGWPLAATQTMAAQLADQSAQITTLQDQLAKVQKTPVTDPAVTDRLTALEGRAPFDPTSVNDRVLALEARLAAIEKLPADGSGTTAAAVAALQTEIQALREAAAQTTQTATVQSQAQLKEAQAIAAETTKTAADLAASVRRLAALGQLQSALDTGAPFAAVLPDLASESDPVPASLADFAETGLPTLTSVKDAFAPAARLALDAALRADMGESWSERATSFLRSQTGARSLEPRDGADPDAVLSRAEAAVNAGDLQTALSELNALPPQAQPPLAEWLALAQTRLAAEIAVAAIAASVGN